MRREHPDPPAVGRPNRRPALSRSRSSATDEDQGRPGVPIPAHDERGRRCLSGAVLARELGESCCKIGHVRDPTGSLDGLTPRTSASAAIRALRTRDGRRPEGRPVVPMSVRLRTVTERRFVRRGRASEAEGEPSSRAGPGLGQQWRRRILTVVPVTGRGSRSAGSVPGHRWVSSRCLTPASAACRPTWRALDR